MGYYIDLSKISIAAYKSMLKTNYLIPSQRILREAIDERFDAIEALGIKNMAMLKQALKNKKSSIEFAKQSNIPENYVIVLRREIHSRHPSARKIIDYPDINASVKAELCDMDIKTSLNLYNAICTDQDKLAKKLNISNEQITHLAKLMDVTRLRYVSPIFATLLVYSDFDTVEKISKAAPEILYNQIGAVNKDKKLFKGKLGLNDAKFLIEDTQHVSRDIIF